MKQQDKQSKKEFKSSFSKEDYELYDLSKEKRKKLVDSGVVSQEKFDGLDTYANNLKKKMGEDIGGNNVTLKDDERGSQLVNNLGDLSKDERKTWESNGFDTKYQDLYDRSRQVLPDNFPDLPKNNKTLSAYADYLEIKSKNPSALKLNDAKKDFVRKSYASELSDVSNELLSSNYTVADKLQAMQNGDVSQDDLEKAMAYDDLLINLKLSSSAKISNTIRRALGYSDAPKASSSSSGGKGGSRKKLTPSDFSLPTDILKKYRTKGAQLAMNAHLAKTA
jgi:hypothetical protein